MTVLDVIETQNVNLKQPNKGLYFSIMLVMSIMLDFKA